MLAVYYSVYKGTCVMDFQDDTSCLFQLDWEIIQIQAVGDAQVSANSTEFIQSYSLVVLYITFLFK